MCVPEDHRAVVTQHVYSFGTVSIPDPAAFAAVDVEGIGIEVRRRAGRAAGHELDRPPVQRPRGGRGAPVNVFRFDHLTPEILLPSRRCRLVVNLGWWRRACVSSGKPPSSST